MERYGLFNQGTLHFAIRNISEKEQSAAISIDTAALGIRQAVPLSAYELTCRRRVPLDHTENTILMKLSIPPGETQVIHLADQRGDWLMAIEQMKRGLDRIERHYGLDSNSQKLLAARKNLSALKGELKQNSLNADHLVACTDTLYANILSLQNHINVTGIINRDKMFYRALDEFSPAPSGLLGVDLMLPATWPEGKPGGFVTVEADLHNAGSGEISRIAWRMESPIPGIWMEVLSSPSAIPPGTDEKIRFRFNIPDRPPRTLVPVLIELRADRNGIRTSMYRVLDFKLF